MTSYPVESRVIRGGAMTAAPVDTRAGYHTYTSARVICRVAMTADTVAYRAGYRSCKSHSWSIHSWVSKSTSLGCSVNGM